jgi:glycosyltransferase involved in cell wall biosynthesis
VKLAVDGGAFQQHIAGGILNVAVGLLNAVSAREPSLSFVLIADPRLGPVKKELIDLLKVRPDIVHGEIGPAYGRAARSLLSRNPCVRFEVDGTVSDSKLVGGEFLYAGPPPKRSFKILSRATSPADSVGAEDRRKLGISIQTIRIRLAGDEYVHVSVNSADLRTGFHAPERAFRWTAGRAELPIYLFRGTDEMVEVAVRAGTHFYKMPDDTFDPAYKSFIQQAERISLRVRTADLESKLVRQGVRGYIANHFLPAHFESLRTYAILHDIIPVRFPSFFGADARDNFAENMRVFLEAAHIFSVSNASRAELLTELDKPPDQVTTIGIDAAPAFSNRPSDAVAAVLTKYGLDHRPYILSVGTLEPRKNHARLIAAYGAVVKGQECPECELVIVGKHGWGTAEIYKQVAELNLNASVRFLTDVSNDELACLYRGALLAAYPSLYEGFGLPVLEAMACGCPVLTSNTSSMPEVAGGAALLVEPTDVESIASGLRTMLNDRTLREVLAQRSEERRRAFSWDNSARKFLDVIQGM